MSRTIFLAVIAICATLPLSYFGVSSRLTGRVCTRTEARNFTRLIKHIRICRTLVPCGLWDWGRCSSYYDCSMYSLAYYKRPVTVEYCCDGWSAGINATNNSSCDIPVCAAGCENNGDCIAPDTCKCQPPYHGFTCNETYDPCQNYADLTVGFERSTNNTNLTTNPKCDSLLLRTWYKIGHSPIFHLPTTCPGSPACGTTGPVWVNTTNTSIPEGAMVSLEACVGSPDSCCESLLPVQIKNCTDFTVYYLSPTVACPQAYCFEVPPCIGCNIKACPVGYVDKDGHCEDIDECLVAKGVCDDRCDNLNGSFACACTDPGYILGADFRSCDDVDECSISNGGCEDICINAIGTFMCFCNQDGYQLGKDSQSCEDINECAVNNGSCSDVCINTNGSYHCECNEAGFVLGGDGHACQDINECAVNNGSCSDVCINTNGSYRCECNKAGSVLGGDGHTCQGTEEAKNCSSIQEGIILGLSCLGDQAIQVLSIRYRQSSVYGGCNQFTDTVTCIDVANNLQTRADLANECDGRETCKVEISPQPSIQCTLEASVTFKCLPVQYMCDAGGYRTESRIYLASIDFPHPLPNDGSTCVCEFRAKSDANNVTGDLLHSSRTHVSECQRTGMEESHLQISGAVSLSPGCTQVNQYNVTTKLITVTLYGRDNPDPFLFLFEAADPGYLMSISCNMITVSSTTKLPPSNPPSTTTSNGHSGSASTSGLGSVSTSGSGSGSNSGSGTGSNSGSGTGSNSVSGSGSNSGSGANSVSGSGSGQQNGTGQSDSLNIGMIGIVAAAVVVIVVVIAVTVILLRRKRGAPEWQPKTCEDLRSAPNMATQPSSEKLRMAGREDSARSNIHSPPPFTRQKTSESLYEEIPYDNPCFEGEDAKAPAPPPRPISTMAPTPGVYAGEYIDMTTGAKQSAENAYMGLKGPHSTAEYSGDTGSEYYLTPNSYISLVPQGGENAPK